MAASSSPISGHATRLVHLKNVVYGVAAVLSVLVAVYSYRYLVGVGFLPPGPIANAYCRPFLYLHIAGAATALLLGPVQFVARIRRRWPLAHRITGRVYVFGCMLGGLASLPIALGTTAGAFASVGFVLLAVTWLVVNTNACRLAVLGRIPEHKEWMIRSFSLTFGAVTLRLFIVLLPAMRILTFPNAYQLSAWAAWLPNLLLAELYLRRVRSTEAGSGSKPVVEGSEEGDGEAAYVSMSEAVKSALTDPTNMQ